jgi:hypothetical protein
MESAGKVVHANIEASKGRVVESYVGLDRGKGNPNPRVIGSIGYEPWRESFFYLFGYFSQIFN